MGVCHVFVFAKICMGCNVQAPAQCTRLARTELELATVFELGREIDRSPVLDVSGASFCA